ncbi:MAG TPA: hypothetical protein VLJ68_00925 [Chitinophagaceae bacterium]|nr:hypothetical protein [Chitinophagaceae bacterium]
MYFTPSRKVTQRIQVGLRENSIKHVLIFTVFLFVFTVFGFSQNKAGLKASVDKKRILIGEQVMLKLEARIPSNQQITLPVIDTIPHFEILEQFPESRATENNLTVISQDMRITSFDSGHWVIPVFHAGRNYHSDTIGIDVNFSEFDPSQDYHDIRDIIEIKPPPKKKLSWYYIIGGAILIVLLAWLLLRKKKPAVTPVIPENAYEDAMKQLDELRSKGLSSREYYSGLIQVFRLYLFRKKGILSMQKTTDGLILQLKDLFTDKDPFDRLSQALRMSDFVKFAKYVPAPSDDQMIFDTLKQSIRIIEDLK